MEHLHTAARAGKSYYPWRCRHIGVGMIPRGEVGLIFAQTGLASGVLTSSLFSAVSVMVLVTTFMAPPLLKYLWPSGPQTPPPPAPEGIQELVMEP